MANLHLVTGYAGENHITADDVGSLNAAIFGTGHCVLKRGKQLAATIVTNNQISIADGDIMMQGRHIRLAEGNTIDLTIENGAQGYYRNDLIVARYTKDTSGVESCELVVIKGTAVTSSPADPEYTQGDLINEHDTQADFPLYRVPLNGLNVGSLVPLFRVVPVLLDIKPSDIGAATASHTHDGRYYTESEIDSKLGGKANTSHTHDDRYYTESEVNSKLSSNATLKALFAAGTTVISSHQYGTSLPTAGTKGRIFFKKV